MRHEKSVREAENEIREMEEENPTCNMSSRPSAVSIRLGWARPALLILGCMN